LSYLDYLFVNRGCQVFNWTAAFQNEHAIKQYERFIKDYCGHKVGIRHYAQKSYTGKVSDINLYEITRREYFNWKGRNFRKKQEVCKLYGNELPNAEECSNESSFLIEGQWTHSGPI
jgi:hypothetical protein